MIVTIVTALVDRRHRTQDRLDRDHEHHERRPVVEEALALDERREPARRPELLEGRDDRDRVGRRDHRPDDEAQLERQAGRQAQHDRDDRGADEHAGRREQHDPAERPPEVVEVDPERGLEDEARQQHEQHDLGRDLQIERQQRAGDQAEDDERDRVRDRDPEAVHDDADEPGRRHEADEQLDRLDRRVARGSPTWPTAVTVRSRPSRPLSRRNRSISEMRSSPDGSRSSSTIDSSRST